MMKMFLRPEEVDVVCGNERDAEFAAKALGFAYCRAVAGREVLDFDVEAVGEDVL